MKRFMDEHFLLHTETAKRLYDEFARPTPILDYHCHIPVADIAEDRRFENLTRAWLAGDHYKWRAMRACGVEERLITGDAPDEEKFRTWAAVVPQCLGNPLYHWSHLELRRNFGIVDLLNPETVEDIWNRANAFLASREGSVRSLIKNAGVKILCTTDDPVDNLRHHEKLAAEEKEWGVAVLPAFRPDAAFKCDNPALLNAWLSRLETAAASPIATWNDLIEALRARHAFFHDHGCRTADYGLETAYSAEYTVDRVRETFRKIRDGLTPGADEQLEYRSALLHTLLSMHAEAGWVQQLHLGAMRNVNSRMMDSLGPDTGYDCIGDFSQGRTLTALLDRLEKAGKLAKTILYSLNPRDNHLLAAVAGCFQGEGVPGRIQLGAAWWFNDQKEGMESHLDALANVGLLSRFVGMLTDSRSFLSYPRHEYFRRLLCSRLGGEIERGELPRDMELVGGMVRDICFNNAAAYFGLGNG